MNRRKIQALTIVVIILLQLILPIFPNISFAQVIHKTQNGITFEIDTDLNTASVYQYEGTESEIVIPDMIDSYPVTQVGNGAFYSCSTVVKVTLPSSITQIREMAFANCTGLTTLVLPEGIKSIEYNAFNGANNLATITLPASVDDVSGSAFSGSGLKEILVNANNQTYISENGVLYNKAKTTLIRYPEQKQGNTFAVPDTVTKIGEEAFRNCSNLISIQLPKSLTTIQNNAFYGCRYLKNITLPSGLTTLGLGAFSNCTSLTEIQIPSGIATIDKETFLNCTSLATVTFSYGLQEIGLNAFLNCSNLNHIVLPGSVTKIDSIAFAECSNLSSILIPTSVKTIGASVFESSTNVTITCAQNSPIYNYAVQNGIAYQIDATLPNTTVSYSNTNPTQESVTVTITSNEKLQPLDGWTISQNELSLTKTYTDSMSDTVKVKDLVGNIKDTIVDVTNIDRIAPELTIRYSEIDDTQKITVMITANEDIRQTEGWTLSENNRTLSKVYRNNVVENIQVQDIAGNITQVEIRVENIDETEMIATVMYSTQDLTNQDVEVTITSNKKLKELSGWKLSEDKLTLTKTYTENVQEMITITSLAEKTLQLNILIENIDHIAPEVEVRYSITEPTNQDITVTIIANEKIQGIFGWITSEDETSLTKTYNTGAKESYMISDLAGNETNIKIDTTYIDKKAPTVQVLYSTQEMTGDFVKVGLISDEKVQPIEGWDLSEDGLTLTKDYYQNKRETLVVRDLVGNETQIDILVANIITPIINIKYYEVTKDNCIIKINPNTTYSKFKEALDINTEFYVQEGETKITDTSLIKTGQQLVVANKIIYTLVVTGDLNGDGKLKLSDLSAMKMHLVGRTSLEGAYLKAADLNYDGNVKLSDLSKIKMVLVGKDSI